MASWFGNGLPAQVMMINVSSASDCRILFMLMSDLGKVSRLLIRYVLLS